MTRPTTLFKHRFFRLCVLLAAVALWLSLRNSSPLYRWDPASIEPYKQWYQINWHSQAVGRASVELQETESHFTIVESDFLEGRVQGRRFEFHYARELDFSKRPPYRLIGGRLYSEEPELTVSASFTNDEKLRLNEQRNGHLYQKALPAVDFSLSDYFFISSYIERNTTLAESFEAKTLNTQTFTVETNSYQLAGSKHQQPYITLTQHHPSNETSWHKVSKDGSLRQHLFPNGMEYIASSKKVTLNPEMQRDLYLNSGVAVDKPLGAVSQIQSLTLGLQNGDTSWFEDNPAVVINETADTIQLQVGSSYKASMQELELFKAPFSRSINPIAKEIALNTIETEASDWQKVVRLVTFVYDYLNYQPVPAGFNIDDILESKIGDCTEFSQLLIEMLLAIDIPAREVSGLVYLGDHEKRFGGHVWVEVLVDGYWIAVDPTWNLTEVTSTHIPVAINLDAGSLTSTKERFAFRLEEIHYKGKPVEQIKRL